MKSRMRAFRRLRLPTKVKLRLTIYAALSLLTFPLIYRMSLPRPGHGEKNEMTSTLGHENETTTESQSFNATAMETERILRAISQMETFRLKASVSEPMHVIVEPSDSHKCQRSGSGLFLLVLIMSSPRNVQQREAIRSVWKEMEASWEQRFIEDSELQNQNRSFRNVSIELPVTKRAFQFLFYIGQQASNVSDNILNEWYRYGDMIIDDLHESYLTLTMKTLRMIRWTVENCPGAQYVMKMDDDVFIHVPKLLRYLLKDRSEKGHSSRLVAGCRVPQVAPDRNPQSKWFSPKDVYKKKSFPPFLRGIMYVFGMQAVREIWQLEESRRLPLLHLEDVYITGIMANETLRMELQNMNETLPFFDLLPSRIKYKSKLAWKLRNIFIHKACEKQLKCWSNFTLQSDKELRELQRKPGYVSCDDED